MLEASFQACGFNLVTKSLVTLHGPSSASIVSRDCVQLFNTNGHLTLEHSDQ